MPKNDFARRLREQREQERKLAVEIVSEVVQRWTAQLCLDVMTIVLNDPEVMGKDTFGKTRLQKLGKEFNKLYQECVIGLSPDTTASHVREQIDRRLKQVWGEGFESWPERYYLWDDRGI